ncbi:MAG TPA: hypothetical protein VFF95_18580 [Candidatus Binatus sp.]|jgi:hypothetical protein|nr:hypothetical protein [Candidatus Binatus sp.]
MNVATKATNELIEQVPEKQIVEELGVALGRTRVWYRAHGRPSVARAITKFLKDFENSLYVGCVADDSPKVKPN